MIKVSVVTITARPGYIDTIAESLANQTLNQNEWELILVDDFVNERYIAVQNYLRGKIKNYKHIPPREIKPYAATCMAVNTGITHCRGELIYFMADYIYPSPRCLERHWEIYSKYGPRVLISGPLIDAIVASGGSVWKGAPPRLVEVVQAGETTAFPSLNPPIPVPLKDDFSELTPENFISVFREPFKPPPLPSPDLPDWRLGFICGRFIEKNLYENTTIHPWSWGWCGANDSIPLEALLEVNGLDESFVGRHGGADGDLSYRLMHIGGGDVWRDDAIERTPRTTRYLVDTEAPAYQLAHPAKKGVVLSETERLGKVEEARGRKAIPNDYSLREEKERILKL